MANSVSAVTATPGVCSAAGGQTRCRPHACCPPQHPWWLAHCHTHTPRTCTPVRCTRCMVGGLPTCDQEGQAHCFNVVEAGDHADQECLCGDREEWAHNAWTPARLLLPWHLAVTSPVAPRATAQRACKLRSRSPASVNTLRTMMLSGNWRRAFSTPGVRMQRRGCCA